MSYSYNDFFMKRWIKWGIIAIVVLILAVTSVSTYNGVAASDQDVQSKWSLVESAMQRRSDLITNEVEVVKGYVKHEEKVFADIAAARSVLYNASSDVDSKLAANEELTASLRNMLVLVENYPDLKASEQFENLQITIEGSENRIAVARKDFIESVQSYNTRVTRFPGNIFARLMGYGTKNYFEASPEAQQAPKVEF